jgi:hypothetical protein
VSRCFPFPFLFPFPLPLVKTPWRPAAAGWRCSSLWCSSPCSRYSRTPLRRARAAAVILVISLLVFASSILTSLFGIGAIIDLPQVPLSGEAVQGNAPQGRSSYE